MTEVAPEIGGIGSAPQEDADSSLEQLSRAMADLISTVGRAIAIVQRLAERSERAT